VIRVPAKNVFPSKQGCATETVAEFLNPETGEWEVLRQTPRTAMDFAPDRMYMDLSCGQEYFIEKLSKQFADSSTPVGTTPDSVKISFRFKTYDVTNPEKAKYDEFTVKVVGSQETLDVYCEYASLAFDPDTLMSTYGAMNYTITDSVKSTSGERVYFDLTTVVRGWDELSATCIKPVYKTLEVLLPDGSWMPVWNEKYMSEYDDNSVLQVVDGISMSFYLSQEDFLKEA
jgi:hypothetical protein